MDFSENIEKENLKDGMSLNPFSHIKGLGIGNFINLTKVSQGYVGQKNVRRALFMFVNLINQQNFENRGLIVTGPSGTGKSSLGIAISKLLFPKFPFVKINGSEIGSSIIPKTEFLHQIIRKTIGICFYQESLIIEGEVVELNLYDEGQKRKLVIRNQNIQSIYELGPKIFKKFLQNKIKKGDFVSIDKVNGEIY
jgi:DNA helicase TIP49 (TBP-interacting protein)